MPTAVKSFLFTMIVGGLIVIGITKATLRYTNPDTYTVEPRLVEMYEHENAYMIWVSDPVSRLFVSDKAGMSNPANFLAFKGGNVTWGDGTAVEIPRSGEMRAAYIVEDPFLFEGQVNLPAKIVCRPALQGPQRGIAKLLYINAPRFDWVGCAVPAQLMAGTDYKETKPWEVSYIKREGRPDIPRIVMGEKGSKVKWWVQDGTWGRGMQ